MSYDLSNEQRLTKDRQQLVRVLVRWFRVNARDLPWRRTRDPYRIWISEVMLQQTQVATVLPYYERWVAELPDLAMLASAPDDKLLKLWEGLGYYSRVRNLKRAAQMILDKHKGHFPREHKGVLNLPGVGPYTAGAICSIAFGQPTPVLDGNVARVLARIFMVPGDPRAKKTSSKLWGIAGDLVTTAVGVEVNWSSRPPRHACGVLNEALMELGALVCLPQNPRCEDCPFAKHCAARRRNAAARFPQRAARRASKRRRLVVFLIRDDDAVLIRQRPDRSPNAGFWELPFVEAMDGESSDQLFRQVLPQPGWTLKLLGRVYHTIMTSRFAVEGYEARRAADRRGQRRIAPPPALQRRKFDELQSLPLSTISRKVIALASKKLGSTAGLVTKSKP